MCPSRRITRLFLCSIPRLSFYDSESPVNPHIHTPDPALISTSHASFYEHHNATKLHENNPDIYSDKDSFRLLSPHAMWSRMYLQVRGVLYQLSWTMMVLVSRLRL